MPYNPERPVVCMDEKPYQLLGEARKPLPMRPGDNTKIDSEYVRKGTSSIFVFTEPLGGIRHISVREQRKAIDWAEEIKYMVDRMYPDVERIILVMDNLNIHAISSLYKRFPAPEARRIVRRLEIHYTPRHGRNRIKCHDQAVSCKKDRQYRTSAEGACALGNQT